MTGCKGDNDPLDIIEIGSIKQTRGKILIVKILGALGLIDENEADWKLIAINVEDTLASDLNSIQDVEEILPGLLDATRDWFKIYKIPSGKPANKFAAEGRYLDRSFTFRLIENAHKAWQTLVSNDLKESNSKVKNISLCNTSLKFNNIKAKDAKLIVETNDLKQTNNEEPKLDMNAIEKLHYINRNNIL
jgi:hypothetical protein